MSTVGLLKRQEFLECSWMLTDCSSSSSDSPPSIYWKFLSTPKHELSLLVAFDNFKSMLFEHLDAAQVQSRFKECMPQAEAPLEEITMKVNGCLSAARKNDGELAVGSSSLELKDGKELFLTTRLRFGSFKWVFYLSALSFDESISVLSMHLTVPAVLISQSYSSVISQLVDVIRKKDRQLNDILEKTRHLGALFSDFAKTVQPFEQESLPRMYCDAIRDAAPPSSGEDPMQVSKFFDDIKRNGGDGESLISTLMSRVRLLDPAATADAQDAFANTTVDFTDATVVEAVEEAPAMMDIPIVPTTQFSLQVVSKKPTGAAKKKKPKLF